MTAVAVPHVFARYREPIERGLRAVLEGPDLPLYTMARYQLGWVDAHGGAVGADRGKALRPTLCLLMCEALGGDPEHALPAAAGVELLHNFSLIHDDVMDGDRTRRHRPTVWSVWGTSQAINAGDLMHVLATLSVLRADDPVLGHDSAEVLARGCARMTEGQHLDIAFEARDDVSVQNYLHMIEGKSAALIGASFEMGAIFAGNDPAVRETVRAYGLLLGKAFQIRDDILGIWGDPQVTGKPAGSDIAKRKKTLPIVHAWHEASDAEGARIRALFTDTAREPDVAVAVAILERAGSLDYAEREAERFAEESDEILDALPISAWGRDSLASVARFITGRTK